MLHFLALVSGFAARRDANVSLQALPTLSLLMPTTGRPELVRHAITMLYRQDNSGVWAGSATKPATKLQSSFGLLGANSYTKLLYEAR